MALFKKVKPYVDPLDEAKNAALGATFSFHHAVNELIDANDTLEKVKGDSLATITVYQERHDEAHAIHTKNAQVVVRLKELLGLDED